MQGIHASRLLFAARVPASQHIQRHGVADLFLDHLIYGAHSTATDALRGGLPMLTVGGPAFSSRVGASLLRALGADVQALLVATSAKDYETIGTRLAEHRPVLQELSRRLREAASAARGLFDYDRYTRHFVRLCQMAKESALMRNTTSSTLLHHLIIPTSQ
jgi:predicted O-linked N-acetylglucosamine transferase (SPINDLY family)